MSLIVVANNLDGQPDDTLTFTGANFTNTGNFSDTQFLVYGQTTASNGTFSDAEIQDPTTNGVLATIPANEPANSMYFVWPESSEGVGSPVAINQTTAQWMEPQSSTSNPLSAGTIVSVYSRNLDNGAGASWIYLQPDGTSAAGQWIYIPPGVTAGPIDDLAQSNMVGDANAYRVRFRVPTNLAAGVYDVWVYNSLGGVYGWSEVPSTSGTGPATMTVGTPAGVQYYYDVSDYGITPSSTDNDSAIVNLFADNYDVLGLKEFYFPAGTYNITAANGQILLPPDSEIVGQGPDSTILEFNGPVPETNSGDFDIGTLTSWSPPGNDVQFQSIGLTYNDAVYDVDYTRSLLQAWDVSNMTLNNVNITSNNILAIFWQNDTNLTLTNSEITGSYTYINNCQDVVLDNDFFWQDYPVDCVAVTFGGDTRVSMTDCSTENEIDQDSSLGPNGYGLGDFAEFDGESSDVYFADNNAYALGENPQDPPQNQGALVGTEGQQNMLYAPVVAATQNTFTVAGNCISLAGGLDAFVTSGPDLGQHVRIDGKGTYDPTAQETTFTINGDFIVPPTGGNIDLAEAATNMVFYQNTLNHSTGSNSAVDFSSYGFNFFEGGYQIVVDGNTVNNTLFGAFIWSEPSSQDGSDNDPPAVFDEIINNQFNVVQTGATNFGNDITPIGVGLISGMPQNPPSPNFYGVVVGENNMLVSPGGYLTSTGSIGISLSNATYQTPQSADFLSVIEHNVITGFTTGVAAWDDPDTLVYKNNLTLPSGTQYGNPVSAIWYATPFNNILLVGNEYVGYRYSYFGDLPSPTVQAPQYVFYLSPTNGPDVLQVLILQNDGPATMSVQVSIQFSEGETEWLTIQGNSDTFTITAESSSSDQGQDPIVLVADPSNLEPGCTSATVTITNDGNQTLSFTLYFIVS